jgi:hypothetical protein
MPVPDRDLGRAVNDRLRRAAAPPDAGHWNEDRGPAAPCVLPDFDDAPLDDDAALDKGNRS